MDIKYDHQYTIQFPNEESSSSYNNRIRNGLMTAMDDFRTQLGENPLYFYVGSWYLKQMLEELGVRVYYTLSNFGEIIMESDSKTGLVILDKAIPQILLKKKAGIIT